MFFQGMVSFQDYHGSGCFKTNPAFYTNDGIANMYIPANAIRSGNGLQVLYGF